MARTEWLMIAAIAGLSTTGSRAQDHVCPLGPPLQSDVDRAVEKGVNFLRQKTSKGDWTIDIERAGIPSGVETIGPHPWYAEGALGLLGCREQNGAWRLSRRARGEPAEDSLEADRWAVIDTALAILFFKRSVPAPVATGVKASGR